MLSDDKKERRTSSRHAKFEFLSDCKDKLHGSTLDIDRQLQLLVDFGEMATKHIEGIAEISGSVLCYIAMHILMSLLIHLLQIGLAQNPAQSTLVLMA